MLLRRCSIATIAANLPIILANHIRFNDGNIERRLATRAREIFNELTPDTIAAAVPLELTLDDTSYTHFEKENRLRWNNHHNTKRQENHNKKRHVKRNSTRKLKDKTIQNDKLPYSNTNDEKNENDVKSSKNTSNEQSDGHAKETRAAFLNEVVDDRNWPHNGSIQSATGRILFKFSSDQIYKCSGTVIQDDTIGRSIVLTAAHCAYNDLSKEFASLAVFIPDQDRTMGKRSDFNCYNDVYGCWILSFAVVERGWTDSVFPENIPYDYAFYVVHDRSSMHRGGYGKNITGESTI